MHRGRIKDLGVRVNFGPIKLCENGCRRHAVEAISMIKYAKFHNVSLSIESAKHIRLVGKDSIVKAFKQKDENAKRANQRIF
jgi:hypothetical protein